MGHYRPKQRRQRRGVGRKGLLARFLFGNKKVIKISFARKKSTKKFLVIVTNHSLKVISLVRTKHQ